MVRWRKTFSLFLTLSITALAGCGGNGHSYSSSSGKSSSRNTLDNALDNENHESNLVAAGDSVGVDLRDVARYKSPHFNEAKTILTAMKADGADFFPQGVRFLTSGPTLSSDSQKNSVYGVEFVKIVDGVNQTTARINSFFNSESTGFIFRTHDISLSADGSKITKIEFVRDVSVTDTRFTMKLGLMQRKIILQDEAHQITKIYPVGLGGFDMGVLKKGTISDLTPKYKIAVLEKDQAIFSREIPSYYAGRPFIRISNGKGNYTALGIHYSITENLDRGFVSHGCVRTRDKDLYELYYLLAGSSADSIPLEMRYWLKDTADTPYPLDDSEYEQVKNFGTADDPEIKRDRDNLMILQETPGRPPESSFADNLVNLMNFQ